MHYQPQKTAMCIIFILQLRIRSQYFNVIFIKPCDKKGVKSDFNVNIEYGRAPRLYSLLPIQTAFKGKFRENVIPI